ncbi:MAG: ABC transporter ATP-binding protein [Legionellales bacterium]|nr:ABC transporter ATP-binding protein [Legionellales bacterium]
MSHIRLNNVCIDYPIYNIEARSLKKHFIRFSTGGSVYRRNSKCIVRGLDHISIDIEHGDRVGVIGHNGAGKSTLLRTLAGIYEPTEGKIEIAGKISSLFNLTLGFDDEATGMENIMIRGILLGMCKADVRDLIQDIIEFTELGDYLNMPVRIYSSGMRLRLAFAIATSVHPEILLIDEVVGAGDANFMNKAEIRFNALIGRSNIVVIAVHNFDLIRKFCNKIIFLNAGKIEFFGEVEEGIAQYIATLK